MKPLPAICVFIFLWFKVVPLVHQISEVVLKGDLTRRDPPRITPERHICFTWYGGNTLVIVHVSRKVDKDKPSRRDVCTDPKETVFGSVEGRDGIELGCFDESAS